MFFPTRFTSFCPAVHLKSYENFVQNFTFCTQLDVLTSSHVIVSYFQLTFRETMADFFSSCTMHVTNTSKHPCSQKLLQHWTGHSDNPISIFLSLSCYFATYVSIFILYLLRPDFVGEKVGTGFCICLTYVADGDIPGCDVTLRAATS